MIFTKLSHFREIWYLLHAQIGEMWTFRNWVNIGKHDVYDLKKKRKDHIYAFLLIDEISFLLCAKLDKDDIYALFPSKISSLFCVKPDKDDIYALLRSMKILIFSPFEFNFEIFTNFLIVSNIMILRLPILVLCFL